MVYKIVRWIIEVLLTVLYLPKVQGRENFPKTGGCIVVCNHTTGLDPLILAGIYRRPIRYMAKIELFKNKLMGRMLKLVGAFPVDRGNADINAIRTSISIVKDGGILGIFPEGHRTSSGEITKVENGVALIAIKAQSPIIPVYINGPYKLFKRMNIIVGKPLDFTGGVKTDTATLNVISDDITKFFIGERKKLSISNPTKKE